MTRADDIRAAYESAVERLFTDREAFAEYLAFSGRFYKLPSAQTITLHDDNPNAEMVTDYDTWKKFGRQVKRGGWSTAVLAGGEIKYLFDISQTVGKDTPYQWKLDRETAEEFVKRFSEEENRTFSGMTACINSLTAGTVRERIDEIASSLDILETDKTRFERSFLSMVRRVAAARCEWKSTFRYGGGALDLSALDLINNTDEAEALLEQVQITAKNVLLSMERTIDNINYERGLKNGKSERNIGRGSTQGMVRGGEDILSGNNDAREQNVHTGREDIHIPSDNGAAADERGAGANEETDKPFRQSVEGVYDGELSAGHSEAAGQNVVGVDTTEDRSRGGRAERGDENEFRENEPYADGRGGTAQMVGEADDAPTRANLRNAGERSEDGTVTSDNEENTLTAEDSSAVNYLSLKIAELSDKFVQKYDGEYREFALANYTFNYALTHTGSEYANPEYDLNLSVRDNAANMLHNGYWAYLKNYLDAIFKEAFEGRVIVDEGIAAGELMSRLAKLDKNRQTVNSETQADISTEPEQMRLFPEPLTKKQQAELEKLTANLTDEFARWEKQFLDGGSDAYYEDGVGLSLIRNHIIYDKHELEKKFPDNLPEIYYKETPPEYPNNYQSVKKGDTLRFEYGDFLVLNIEKTNEYSGEYAVQLQDENGEVITQNLRDIKTKFRNLTNRGEVPSRADISDITNIPSDLDKIYVDKDSETVRMVYYNPDSSAGGQLVYNEFDFDDIFAALGQNAPMDFILSTCKQTAVDVDMPGFDAAVREFLADTEDFNSRDEGYLDKLFALPEPTYSILQLKDGADTRDYRFAGIAELHERGLYVDRENYSRVYRGRLKDEQTLEDIYTKFNVDRPSDFYGHSLSTGDVIGIVRDGKPTAYYIDSVGFEEIPDFLLSREERKARRTLTDNLVLIADNQLASDEMDTLGDKLFDYENAPHYKGDGSNWLIGNSTTADKFEEITTRYHNGEDVRAELAKGMYTDNGELNAIEFFGENKDGIGYVNIETSHDKNGMTFKTKGGFEITYSWEQLGDAMITAARKEYDRHEALNKAYREDLEKNGNLYLALRDGRTIYLNRTDDNSKNYMNYRLESDDAAAFHSTLLSADDADGNRVQLRDFGTGNYDYIIHSVLKDNFNGSYELSSIENEPIFKVERNSETDGEAVLKSYIKSNDELLPGEVLYSGSVEDCEKCAEWLRLGENSQEEIKEQYRDALNKKYSTPESMSQVTRNDTSVTRELSIGDQFRSTATGEVSKVTELTGALPWYTDDCTVVRESGGFIITENIGKKDLLNSEKYEFLGNEKLNTEEMTADFIPYNEKKVITATRIGDFYEFYGDTAEELSEKFNLTLTERGGKPMVGIPDHRFDDFCGELYDKGYIVTNWQHYQDVIKPHVEENPSMIRAETLINEFCENEYEGEGDFTNRLRVGLAYTDDEETGYPIEVYADLEYHRIITEFNNVIVSEEKYKSLDEMCDLALEHLDFDNLVYLPNEKRSKVVSPVTQSEVLDVISDFRTRTDEHYKKLAGYSAHNVEELAKQYIREAFRENEISADVGEVVLYGSRSRGMEHDASDLDFVAEIYTDMKEDALFNILHETPFEIGGAAVDINPIRAEETGSLEDYLLGAERYLQQKGAKGKTVPEAQDYRIEETEQTSFGPKARYTANISAIRALNQIESENRVATPEEQKILAQYVGWGGIPQAFDSDNSAWATEYKELKELLTPDEYEAARSTVLTAHYTSPTVISAIYKVLGNFGFKGGNVLEPAMGIGNFFGVMPEGMRSQSQMHGVELDEISGRIAKQLYPNADIQICGYENTDFPDNFFDAAVGNVPFGNYGVSDTKYNRENFLIHDYFFAKTLDKVAPGGVVAFITSKGTLDKESPKVREYLAKRADLIGAIRLPNNAFKANAGTEVTADIIFLQKREKMSVEKPDWCYTAEIAEGISVNQYFADHPEMILGEMRLVSGRYGEETACVPIEGANLEQQLDRAVRTLKRDIIVSRREEKRVKEHGTIPATAGVRNFTYTEIDGKIYFRENNIMTEVELKGKDAARVRGLIGVRNAFYELVDAQRDACSDKELSQLQSKLNTLYDEFVKSFGFIGDIKNRNVFGADDSCNALCGGLETENPKTHEIVKTDIFTKRTIKPFVEVTHTDTPLEALYVSLDMRGFVDIDYMSELCGISGEKIANELWENGFIFKNPETEKYEEAAEYLSGYVRDKLKAAQKAAEENSEYERNVAALEKVQPEKLGAGDISVRIGVPWVTIEDYCEFFREYAQGNIKPRSFFGNDTVLYRSISGEYKITNKGGDNNRSVAATSSFGTARMNSLEIFENLLNNRDMTVRDAVPLPDGKTKYVLNKKETQLAQEKARQMKEAFPKWLWEKQERREKYVEIYNELFNSLVGREYDGSHQTFPGMNPFIELNEHQKNAVMRCKLGGNTLLAHCVGAGKTFEMAAAVMEKRRLGLINKACIVVPKHLVGQMSAEWLRLYPQANILTATEKDFDKNHRQKFIGRCCTGDYDAVIMSYQQFQKIPMSVEYQRDFLMKQIDEITGKIGDFKNTSRAFYADEKRSVKDLEMMKKRLNTRLQKLLDTPRDTSLSFEQLGFDCIVADEAHNYKNGLVVTKMKNVSGIGSKAAKKCEDFLMKTDYLNEKFGERNLILASGTPISNSMTELYIMQKYMRPSALQKQGLQNFDDWASTFGEVVTQLELKPAGDGFRMKKRFAKFVNLAELMQSYKDFADIRTAEMLNLPVPEIEGGKPQVISAKPDEFQKAYMQVLAKRSEAIHNGNVDPTEDNMLKITGEARLLGLDARCLNSDADNSPTSKVNLLVDKVMEIYADTTEQKGVQAIFCDIAINGGAKPTDEIEINEDGEPPENTELSAEQQGEILAASKFSVYDYIKAELIRRGIPEQEICFAGDAKNQGQRGELYAQLREGTKRIVLASTSKMGTGANIQTRLCALHNLDIPWKPSDFEQRLGRIVRQGNSFPTVKIFNYVTEGTFDAYMLNLIVTKQKFISQLMSGKTPARTCEDVDEMVLNYSEMQAIASGDPRIKEKIQLDTDVSRLRLLESEHLNKKYQLEDRVTFCQAQISIAKKQLDLAKADKSFAEKNALPDGEFKIVINGTTFTERKDAGAELRKAQMRFLSTKKSEEMGEYCGFKMSLNWGLVSENQHTVMISLTPKIGKGLSYSAQLELQNDLGNITRLENILKHGIDKQIDNLKYNLARNEKDLSEAERTKDAPFEFADELAEKSARLATLNVELGVDKKDEVTIDEESKDGDEQEPPKHNKKPKGHRH